MEKIEFAGRLKTNIVLDSLSYECNDVNLDKDFLIILSKYFVRIVGCSGSETQFKYSRFFENEIICIVEFTINFDSKKYKVVFTRDTQSDKIIIGCEITTHAKEIELFGSVYELKIKVINLFTQICDSSSIFLLEDFNNELICQDAYLQIHKAENRFRNLLTKYLIRKYGYLVFSKPLKNDVDNYSKWFKKESNNKYKTFKKVNTDYANLDFSKLVKILELYDAKCIDSTGTSIASDIDNIFNDLADDINYVALNSIIHKIKEKVSNRIRVFDDIGTKPELDKVFGFDKNTDISTILDSEFRKLWETQLSKMRNMVAHNKPICKELYNDIQENIRKVNIKFDKCFDYIDDYFYSDEEGVLSNLEEMACEEERNRFDIEEARENVGIQFSLNVDAIEEQIIDSENIRVFIDTVSALNEMNKYIEAIDSVNDELRFMDEENVSIEFKENIFNHIKDILSLDCDFADYQSYAVINMLYELAYQDIDIDRAIDFYSYNNYHIPFSDNFEMFSFDYLIKWLTTDNKKYEIQFYGELNPENNWSDTLEFKLYLDKNKLATYPIIVDYGDYMAPSEGGIDDMRVNQLVEDIAKSINNTVDIYEKLYQLSKKIMEEI